MSADTLRLYILDNNCLI